MGTLAGLSLWAIVKVERVLLVRIDVLRPKVGTFGSAASLHPGGRRHEK